MNSFILVGSEDHAKQKIVELTTDIAGIDLYTFSFETPSIGIEQVRKLQHVVSFAPAQSRRKAVVLYGSHKLTAPAQNAFLKTLEEPPQDTLIILQTETLHQLLPTLLSRCQITQLASPSEITHDSLLTIFLNQELKISVGRRLLLVGKIGKSKEEIVSSLQSEIYALHKQLLTNNEQAVKYKQLLQKLSLARHLVRRNVNPRLVVENLLLKL